jgi:chemotaxis protein MotB
MHTDGEKIILVFLAAAVFVLLPGCTNWPRKYEALNVEHQNLTGLYENCRSMLGQSVSEKADLAEQVSEGRRKIEEMQEQIMQYGLSPGEAAGFGDQYQVDVDAAAGTVTVTLPNTILFSSGKADLKKEAGGELNNIVSVLKTRYEGSDIDVIGHTDTDPIKKSKWKDNWQLSAERALAVVRYIESQGIEGQRLRAIGCGEKRPVASNANASGKAKNRRVEIVVNMRGF